MDNIIRNELAGKVFEVYAKLNEKSALWYEVFAFTEKSMRELIIDCLKNTKKIDTSEIRLRSISITPSIMSMSLGKKIENGMERLNRPIQKSEQTTTGRIFRGQARVMSRKNVLNFEILATDTESAEKFIKNTVRMRFPQSWPCDDFYFIEVINNPSILRAKLVGLKIDPEIPWEVM